MCPSPTMPRESSASGGSGVIQSPIWYDAMRAPARATWSSTPGSHHRWKVSTTTPTCSTGNCSAMSRAWREGRDDATVGGEDRVHRLDPEPHAAGAGLRGQLGDGVGGAVAGGGQVAVAGGQAAGHQHQDRGAEGRGLVERPQVVVVRLPSGRRVGDGEEAAPADRRDPEPCVAQPGRRRSPARPRRPVPATRRSPADRRRGSRRSPRAAYHARGGALVEREPGSRGSSGAGVATRAAAPEGTSVIGTLPSRRASRIRYAARSGSRSRPASSASSKTGRRCSALRADCRPPTMVNPGWWPLSQARNAIPVL